MHALLMLCQGERLFLSAYSFGVRGRRAGLRGSLAEWARWRSDYRRQAAQAKAEGQLPLAEPATCRVPRVFPVELSRVEFTVT